jgi:hypothetical protein
MGLFYYAAAAKITTYHYYHLCRSVYGNIHRCMLIRILLQIEMTIVLNRNVYTYPRTLAIFDNQQLAVLQPLECRFKWGSIA